MISETGLLNFYFFFPQIELFCHFEYHKNGASQLNHNLLEAHCGKKLLKLTAQTKTINRITGKKKKIYFRFVVFC